VCDASGQKIKIVLVADYYCKNAHSTAAKKKKRKGGGKEAEKGEAAGGKKGAGRRLLFCCFCFAFALCVFVFPFFIHSLTHTQRRILNVGSGGKRGWGRDGEGGNRSKQEKRAKLHFRRRRRWTCIAAHSGGEGGGENSRRVFGGMLIERHPQQPPLSLENC